MNLTSPEKFAIARRARQHARRVRYPENARRSFATSGYFAASASTSPISTSTFSTPGHSVPRTEEPAPLSDNACSVERIPRDQKLHALAGAEIRTDYGALACAVFVQHKNFNGITQVTVIKLIVSDAMESHRRIGRNHEIESGARWPAIKKWCWEPAGRNSLVADKCDAHETARGVRLEFEQRSNLLGGKVVRHFVCVEHRTSNIERPTSDRAGGQQTSNFRNQRSYWRD